MVSRSAMVPTNTNKASPLESHAEDNTLQRIHYFGPLENILFIINESPPFDGLAFLEKHFFR